MGEFSLQGLKFGTYTLQIKVRSRNGNGPPATRTVKLEASHCIYFLEPHFYWSVLIVLLCGGICISMGIGIMEVLFWKRRKKTPEQPQGEESNQENKSYGEILLENTLKRLDASYVIPSDALKVEHLLGRGCFGKVYHGVLTQPSGEERPVAVKTLMKQVPNEDLQRFLDEAVVMQGIKTNFLVRLIGVVDNFPPIYVVMELMERGDLKTFLRTEGAWISNEKMIEMAVEAADGMAYLQAKNLVHRDLAARNCMLDAELTLKIGDFGLSRYVATDYYRKQSRGMLPVRWMAPESLKNGHYSARSDVWSYGVLLWELATGGKLPYEEYTDVIVDDLIISGKRLKRPIRGPSFFYPLMILCWALDSSQRPTFKRLVQRLLLETSTSYQEYFQGVSFFHSSSPCTLESLDDIDEGFNASGSSQEDAEAGDSGSSSSLQPFHCFARQNNPFSNEDMECQCNEEDIGADDDMVFLTPVEPNGRSSCAPLSCIASHGARHTPSTDTPNRNLFPTHCLTET
ncbi:Insulin-like receptor [Chionoecetes opilio]|uniref:Insulin-like receptor n=1 Tax=Chionoecetes opilio TaxID=41210 RepID=A0A8J4YN51_CHIOP|nr:Insulin-like receptor [Chionoecetes opilio]